MRKTVVCSVKMITKSGWSAQTTAWQAWCRVAVPAQSGKIRIDANSLKNQPLAIDACIILKPSAVTATASKPRESSDVLSNLKTINFRSYLKNAFNTRWQSFKLKSCAYSNKWAKVTSDLKWLKPALTLEIRWRKHCNWGKWQKCDYQSWYPGLGQG